MNKPFSTFWLAGVLIAAGTVSGSSAQAAITGKIGVGTWDTQAEFADVKVVQGTTTLYQSDFTANQTGWTTSGGTWGRQNGYFRQTGGGAPAMAWVGNTTWTNYTLTLKARKISGNEGFLVTFGAPGDVNNYWWNIGGWGNSKHVINTPGVVAPEVAGNIQNNVWYDIKVQLAGNDIKCYLNGALIQSTTRVLDASERTERIQAVLNSPGYQLLTVPEKSSLQELFNRNVYLGQAARDTFSAMPGNADFAVLSAFEQLKIIRKVGAKRLTWNRGYGYGSDTWRDNFITDSMDTAVIHFNSVGVFDKHVTANNDPSVPTAWGSGDGQMAFGSQMTVRVCIHEIHHTLGVGTHPRWWQLMVNGKWTGQYANRQFAEFEGAGATISGDGGHYFNDPYAMGQDYYYNPENARRSILLMFAFRRDLGIADTLWMPSTTSVPNGTYRIVPRNAMWASLSVNGSSPSNSTATSISQHTGAANQQFLVDLQTDGTYRIRTALSGNRPIELPGGVSDNGTPIKLWDNNGNDAQRWYFIPMRDGWFKIAPKNNIAKGMDINGGEGTTANGSVVQVWDYLDGTNQQWKFAPVTGPSYTTTLANGTYRITPRHATGSSMEVLNSNSANNAQIAISSYSGAANQKFLLEKQTDNSYSIRTSLTDNRALDLPFGDSANGNKLVTYDNINSNNQRWFLVPTDIGWFKIAPKVDPDAKCIDVAGGPGATANGTLVHNWDYLNATNQQWKFEAVVAAALAQSTGSSQTTSSNSATSTQNVVPQTKPSGNAS